MNVKPISLNNGHHNTKWRAEARENAENKLKGQEIDKDKVPSRLTKAGKDIYKESLNSFPDKFLTSSDTHTLEIVANSLAMMHKAQRDINKRGLLVNDSENPSIRIYEKYSKIFNTFGSKLGMSPRDRASLAVMLVNQETDKADPLLEALKDDE